MSTDAYFDMLMRSRIRSGWSPTPGTYWKVLAYDTTANERYVVSICVRAPDALSAVLQGIDDMVTVPDRVDSSFFAAIERVVTDADVLAWPALRDAWLQAHPEVDLSG